MELQLPLMNSSERNVSVVTVVVSILKIRTVDARRLPVIKHFFWSYQPRRILDSYPTGCSGLYGVGLLCSIGCGCSHEILMVGQTHDEAITCWMAGAENPISMQATAASPPNM